MKYFMGREQVARTKVADAFEQWHINPTIANADDLNVALAEWKQLQEVSQ